MYKHGHEPDFIQYDFTKVSLKGCGDKLNTHMFYVHLICCMF